MTDYKKLCQKDKWYWLVAIAVLLLYSVVILSAAKAFQAWVEAGALWDQKNAWVDWYLSYGSIWSAGFVYLYYGVFYAQFFKLLLDRTGYREETQHVFAVKRYRIFLYDLCSGFLMVTVGIIVQCLLASTFGVEQYHGWYADTGMISEYAIRCFFTFAVMYSFFLLCKAVTNRAGGAILTYFVAGVGALLLLDSIINSVPVERFFGLEGSLDISYVGVNLGICVFLLGVAFFAELKRPDAGSGMYAFRAAHWTMMAVCFAEIYMIFLGAFLNFPYVLSRILAFCMACVITAGVHYLTRAKGNSQQFGR